mmetsp:Transcript_12862/g.30138  ORF Transcript_12862/g.30138 Transcript_12862/m.30138 type:complete len:166 (+) Transcript_12862:58-555(+)
MCDDETVAVWMRPPRRRAASIFGSHGTKGTFFKDVPPRRSTVVQRSSVLDCLFEGRPVASAFCKDGEKLVPTAHLPLAVPVRTVTNFDETVASSLRPGHSSRGVCRYPREGTEFSLAYRNPYERAGAHAGWGPEVSVCASPRCASTLSTPRPSQSSTPHSRSWRA